VDRKICAFFALHVGRPAFSRETEPSQGIMDFATRQPGKRPMKSPDIGIKSNTKAAMIALCNARLADAIDLSLAVKQAHWNLKGPSFIGVHELLDEVRVRLDNNADTVAERVAQLDGIALGTTQKVEEATKLAPYPTDIHAMPDHVGALVERFAALSKSVREAIAAADDAGDAGTADIFTSFSRDLDKDLWFLNSHLQ
jgi:starvation-inducible DNA-binding protein